MKETKLVCICCPFGCEIRIKHEGGKVISIEGNRCKRGEQYARAEIEDPRRVLATTVRVEGGLHPVLPVRTKGAIPKAKIFEAMKVINKTKVKAPVKMGQAIIENLCGTGVDLIAERDMPAA